MKAKNFFQKIIFALGHLTPGAALLLLTRHADANPIGATVQNGVATFSVNGSTFTVNAGNNAWVNWQSFNIAAGEKTIFNQPSASAIVWNHINDQSPSQIYGSLQANGVVVLLNSSGFYFGPNSFVSAAGLVVSTASYAPPQNAGGAWIFNGPPPLASIVNFGQIKIGHGGDCFLIADKIENHGNLEAPGGNIGFAAGQTVMLSERADGRGMSMNVTLPQGSVDNYGNVIADGGTIALNAKVVNQNGFIQANSVQNRNGVIELVAADSLTLGADSQILANGDASLGGSAGGTITLKSDGTFSDAVGSRIAATGGANGGNGGAVEISAPKIASLNSKMDATATDGWSGGKFLLDPVDLLLGNSTAGGAINVTTAFAGFANILLQASGNITLANNLTWNLSGSTGKNSGTLALQAAGNLILGAGSLITDANNWSVSLAAGYDSALNHSTPGSGSILFNGNAAIQTAAGAISLLAGKDITVGSGYVITKGGGNIDAHALTGNINTGSAAIGYVFKKNATTLATAYDLSDGLGGISTAAGGDVNLTAGGNIASVLPGNKGYFFNGNFVSAANSDYTTAGAGAYGKQAGNVNVIAGGNVTGHFLVANGVGKIFAGVQMDANGNPLTDLAGKYILGGAGSAGTSSLTPNFALSLISGGWNVTAAQNIFLQEVRNPNGVFNINGAAALKHYFDYAPNDFVTLNAGNEVLLGGSASALPRVDSPRVPVIYPGILNILAGAGGVVLNGDSFFNQLILFPSPLGGLVINTTGGGSLRSQLPTSAGAPQIFNLVISDSSKHQFRSTTDFGVNDHADVPVHLNSEQPVELNISGDLNLISLTSPEAAEINVVGNVNNSRLQAMNLKDTDVSSLTAGQAAKLKLEQKGILNTATDGGLVVGGNINNRSAFTSVDLGAVAGAGVPVLSYLAQSQLSSPSTASLLASFYYNPATKVLTYQNITGVSLETLLGQLQNLPVQVFVNGVAQWDDPPYNTIPKTTTVSVFDAATATALLAKYNSLGAVPAGNQGYAVGGGGQFQITANNLDLGTTPGIQSRGVGYYRVGNTYPLASFLTHGADIAINLSGNLDMYSSSIATLNGGAISIHAGGSVNAGSSDFNVTALGARGIFSTGPGDVSVIAGGNVNVNGSRIAAYNGGNVTVESLHGNVNAGSGGAGYVVVNSYTVNPLTRAVKFDAPTIPGSGILTTTFPGNAGQLVGNILIETPNGNVNASAGGIVQLPLNGENSAIPVVEVLAGYELRDGLGQAVDAAHLAAGTPTLVSAGRNIDATGSGVIAQNVILKATGDIKGVIFSKFNITLDTPGTISVQALGKSIDAKGGSFGPGLLIGTDSVNAGGADPSQILSNDANGGGGSFAQGTAANSASQAASSENSTPVEKKSEDENNLPKKKGIALAQKVSRVTVLLPAKN